MKFLYYPIVYVLHVIITFIWNPTLKDTMTWSKFKEENTD